jgi:hypothetical protein
VLADRTAPDRPPAELRAHHRWLPIRRRLEDGPHRPPPTQGPIQASPTRHPQAPTGTSGRPRSLARIAGAAPGSALLTHMPRASRRSSRARRMTANPTRPGPVSVSGSVSVSVSETLNRV